jgi:chitinase
MSRINRLALAAMPVAMFAAYAYAAPAWQEGTTYSAGTVVSHKGSDYSALVTHTAYVGAGWTPDTTPTLWKLVGAATATATPQSTVAPTATPVGPTAAPTTAPTAAPTATPVGLECNDCLYQRSGCCLQRQEILCKMVDTRPGAFCY